MGKLLKTTAKGVAWTTISSILRNVVSLVQIAILARILSKEDFGIIAIANVVLGFISIFLDLGISVGILYKQDITRNQYSSLFWLNIILGVLLTGIVMLISPLIANIYKEPTLTQIISLLSLSILFNSFGSQHRTVQQKEMRFQYIAIVDIISSVVAIIIAVITAMKGFGIFSLVFSTLASSFISSLIYLSIGLSKDRNIFFHFSLKETFPFLRIGIYQIGASIFDFFSRELDIIFIGSAFGKDNLGVYSLCKKIVQSVYATINPIFTKVLTPLLAKLQMEKDNLRSIYMNIVETLSLINFPVYILISIFAYGILYILYGIDYVNDSFLLSILALYYGILTVSNPVGSLQVALGRTDIGFYWTIYRILSTILIIFIASYFDINTLVVLYLILAIVNTIISWRFQLKTMINLQLKSYLWIISKPLLISLIISIPYYVWFSNVFNLWYMIILSLIYCIMYLLIVCCAMKDSYVIRLLSKMADKFKLQIKK